MIKKMKKRCLAFVIAAVLALPTMTVNAGLLSSVSNSQISDNQTTIEYGIYKVLTRSNLRATASRDGRWIATLPQGSYVIMLDRPAEFCKIDYAGSVGYVYRGCICKVEGAEYDAACETLGIEIENSIKENDVNSNQEIPAHILQYVEEQQTRSEMLMESAKEIVSTSSSESVEVENSTEDVVAEDINTDLEEKTEDVTEATDIMQYNNLGSLRGSSQATALLGNNSTDNSVDTVATIEYEEGTIVTNAVMRKLPSADSAKIMTVIKNSKILIIDEGENGYLHISYNDQEGYIFARTISRSGNVTRSSGVLDSIVTQDISQTNDNSSNAVSLVSRHISLSATVSSMIAEIGENNVSVDNQELSARNQVTANTLENNDIEYQIRARANMREIPSQQGNRITTLPIGANVELLGETADGYTLVQYNGIQGYVLESVVVDSEDFANMMSNQAQSTLYVLTGYCTCAKCCGNFSPEVTGREAHTATGTTPTAGRTIAVDPSVIPYGSVVHIDGLGDYIAEDCGGAVRGNHIDVYFDSHQDALAFGRQRRYVTIN